MRLTHLPQNGWGGVFFDLFCKLAEMLLPSFWEDQSVISKLAASHLHHGLVHVCIFWLFFSNFCKFAKQLFKLYRVIWYAWTTFFTFGIYNLEPYKSEHKHSPTTHKLPTTYQLITSTSKNFRSYELFEFSPSEAKSLSATFLRLHILHSWGALHFSFNGLSAPHQSGTVVEFMDSLLPALIYIFDSLMIQPDFTVKNGIFWEKKSFVIASAVAMKRLCRSCVIVGSFYSTLLLPLPSTTQALMIPDARKSQRNGKASRK